MTPNHLNHLERLAREFPWDAGKDFWEERTTEVPKPHGPEHLAARMIVQELEGREGFNYLMRNVKHSVRYDIVATIRDIIEHACK